MSGRARNDGAAVELGVVELGVMERVRSGMLIPIGLFCYLHIKACHGVPYPPSILRQNLHCGGFVLR